jgi:hypothetical protein
MGDCGIFERDLARLLDDALEAAELERLTAALRSHGAACAACRPSLELVELCALPAEGRRSSREPADAYWAAFNERVRRRIEVDAGSGRPAARSAWWGALAAAVAVATLAGWLAVIGRGPAISGAPRTASADFPPELVERLAGADSAEVAAQLEALAGWNAGWDSTPVPADDWDGAIFPDVEQLSAGERLELLAWLERQRS